MKTKGINNVGKVAALSIAVGAMLTTNGIVANAHPKTMEDGTVFDAEYYAQKYEDVVAVYGTDESSLFKHYIDFGRTENREAVELPDKSVFDSEFYASANPDVAAVYGAESNNLYQHYLQYGKDEGRAPTASAAAAVSIPTSTPDEISVPEETVTSSEDTTSAETQASSSKGTKIVLKVDSNGNYYYDIE